MSKLFNPLLSLTAILLAVAVWVHYSTSSSDTVAESESASRSDAETESYRPRLEHDPPVPDPQGNCIKTLWSESCL